MPETLFDLAEPAIRRTAAFSPCRTYRYLLTRAWAPEKGVVNWIMLNPSKADEADDDATIRRCIRYARDWDFGGIEVTNLFAFCATDPREMKAAADPIGPENDAYIRGAAGRAKVLVCAWGNHAFGDRADRVQKILVEVAATPLALRITSLGQPSHPVRLPRSLKPFPF